MPLALHKQINAHSAYAVWRIDEPSDTLMARLQKADVDANKSQHEKGKSEYAASRLLINDLCTRFGLSYQGITKDEFEKPHLVNLGYHISISHSYPYAGAMLHLNSSCGIDIERLKEKIRIIAPKFINEQENQWVNGDIEKLVTVWSAKETLYKIYGRKRLAFKENMSITPDTLNDIKSLTGVIITESSEKSYKLGIERIEDFIITFLES